jgi:cytochrome b
MTQAASDKPAGVRVKLWDAPVRIVHWALVILIAFSWWSTKNHKMEWHLWSGYLVLALVVFRIYWGFVGAGAARFSSFVKGPRAVVAYARTLPSRTSTALPGHNPVGAVSVLVILLSLGTQVATGLFATDVDGINSGPLSYMVSFDFGRALARVHRVSFTILETLIVLHVVAVLFYLLYKRMNLVGPMITGHRRLPTDPGLSRASPWRLIAGVALALLAMVLLAKGLRPFT